MKTDIFYTGFIVGGISGLALAEAGEWSGAVILVTILIVAQISAYYEYKDTGRRPRGLL